MRFAKSDSSECGVGTSTTLIQSTRQLDTTTSVLAWSDHCHEFNAAPGTNTIIDRLDSIKDFSSLTASIYDRDALHCRYCESRVLPKAVFELLSRRIPTFTLGRSNEARPGIYLVYCATLDHVVPHAAGGRTDAENLVTSCWPCNYGKFKYSLEQLGLDSPFEYEPIKDREWVSMATSLATP